MKERNIIMKKIILFGAGVYGEVAYYKLKLQGDIEYYVDNNPSKQNTKLHNIPIISSQELKKIYDSSIYDIVICIKEYYKVIEQLNSLGINEYYIMLCGLLYSYDTKGTLFPVKMKCIPYIKKEITEKNILFVQEKACIRTHKIASVLKNNGYKVFLLQAFPMPGKNDLNFEAVYDEVYTFYTYDGLINFIDNSDFDIIHSSNEPDMLTNLLLMTKKHIVFDTHDMMSLRKPESVENLVLEYIANKASDGNIYTSNAVVEIARKKFDLADKEIIAWENTVLEQEEIISEYKKLSSIDGELHCVYEGAITGNDKMHHRFFEDIWEKIADFGVHIHYYSASDYIYCKELENKSKYFHYEGNLDTKKLIQEMTKYDCGLAVFNANYQNRIFLESGTANKMYEYINARIPVAVGNVCSYIDFVEKYGIGKKLDMERNIKEQIAEISKIKIEKDFLAKNELTMMSKCRELIEFYEKVKKKKVRRWQ